MLKPCSSLEEFVQKYDKDLERILAKSFKNYINLENLPDVKNKVYIHLLEKNFFKTYDPTKAAFSTYLYTYLFKFLKGEYLKDARKVDRDALSIDHKVYQEGNVTILDVHDFKKGETGMVGAFELNNLDKEIQNILDKKLKKLKIYNPYPEKTLYSGAWGFLETPRTFEEVCEHIEASGFLFLNPYDKKKDAIKYQIWEEFGNKGLVEATPDKVFWAHVGGVKLKPINVSDMSMGEKRVLLEVQNLWPCSYFEVLLQLRYMRRNLPSFHRLFQKGFLDGDDALSLNFRPYFRFNRIENLAWHVILYFQEKHSELMEFDNGKYHLNTQSNPTVKFFRMIVNGKTNKEIANTYKVNTSTFLSTKRSILKDLKRIV